VLGHGDSLQVAGYGKALVQCNSVVLAKHFRV
jgi:hypothetical protein